MRSRILRGDRGQSLLEFAIVLPLCVVILLGVIDYGYALLDQHVVTKIAREGSNLISRNTSLQDAGAALQAMSSPPVDFGTRSTVIFSVIRNVPTIGANNYNKAILYQRYQLGAVSATSVIGMRGSGSFGGAPDYSANNPDNNTGLQVTGLPGGMVLPLGGTLYVTEIFSQHTVLTPLSRFGVPVPSTLYSIAYF